MNSLTIVLLLVALAAHATVGVIDKEKMMEVGKKCKEETNASDDDVKVLMEKQKPTTIESKCMMACIFKTLGVLDADGKFDGEANVKLAEDSFSDKPEKIEKTKAFIAACKDRINAVDDDAKACERAAEVHNCAVEKAKELGYSMDD